MKSKRERMMYAIILVYVVVGIYGIIKGVDLMGLAAYFGSLTGFVAMYLWGETKRPSEK